MKGFYSSVISVSSSVMVGVFVFGFRLGGLARAWHCRFAATATTATFFGGVRRCFRTLGRRGISSAGVSMMERAAVPLLPRPRCRRCFRLLFPLRELPEVQGDFGFRLRGRGSGLGSRGRLCLGFGFCAGAGFGSLPVRFRSLALQALLAPPFSVRALLFRLWLLLWRGIFLRFRIVGIFASRACFEVELLVTELLPESFSSRSRMSLPSLSTLRYCRYASDWSGTIFEASSECAPPFAVHGGEQAFLYICVHIGVYVHHKSRIARGFRPCIRVFRKGCR